MSKITQEQLDAALKKVGDNTLELLKELGVEVEEPGEWKPKYGEAYYTSSVEPESPIYRNYWDDDRSDKDKWWLGRVAPDEETAKLYQKQEQAWKKLWELSDYDNNTERYYIPSVSSSEGIVISCPMSKIYTHILSPSFISSTFLLESVKDVGHDLIRDYIVRMSKKRV